MFLLIITIASVFIIDGTFAGNCKDYETCKKLAPALNGTCDEIKSRWNDTFACLTKSGACSDVAGVGVMSGLCQGYIRSYAQTSNCTAVVCESSGHPASFNNTKQTLCYQPAIYPDTCNETKYKLHHNCLKDSANDLFTEAIVQGMCENFRIANGTKCSFSLGTCKLVDFTTGTNGTFTNGTIGTTMAPGTTVVGNSTPKAALPPTSGACMFVASFFTLLNAAGVAYWLS